MFIHIYYMYISKGTLMVPNGCNGLCTDTRMVYGKMYCEVLKQQIVLLILRNLHNAKVTV